MTNIIIPVYNTDFNLFKKALFSCFSQTKKCLISVIDDASRQKYSEKYSNFCKENNIHYVRKEINEGAGLTRQYGIEHGYTLTKFVMFLDADDVLVPNAVELLESSIENNDVAVGNIIRQGLWSGSFETIPLESSNTWMHGKLYRRDFLINNNLKFSESIKYNEDAYFNMIALPLAKKVHIDFPVYIWCYNRDSITRNEKENFGEKYNYLYLKANLQGLEFLLKNKPDFAGKHFGTILGQIFNSYCLEKALKNKNIVLETYEEILKNICLNNKDFILENEKYIKEGFLNIAKIGEQNRIFDISPLEWYEKFIYSKE